MPDISKINNVAVADISKLDSITFADGQKVNNQSVSLVSDAHTLIATATASASATLSFTSGIDSTYDAYEFRFDNVQPVAVGSEDNFGFQVNAVGQTGFNEVMTTTAFEAYHNEADTAAVLVYDAAEDQAQGTAYQVLGGQVGADSDQSLAGVLTLYAPSSTTYVKHFTSNVNIAHQADYQTHNLRAGYINTTSAIDEISFKFASGNIDAGVIKMYGIAKA